ncbi:hypothetical protein GJAV_G00090530 [Gymnothorax javanicus]|nr:hypothetical protein GJAV_G00090530 [Gymnothorax javanicus]
MLLLLMSTLLVSVCLAEEVLVVPEGSAVRLDVRMCYEPHYFFHILRSAHVSWIFNGSTEIVDYDVRSRELRISDDYNTTAEFDERNYSLLLKNVQQTHSGIFSAEIRQTRPPALTLTTYKLVVQGSVPPVAPSFGLSLSMLKAVVFSVGLVAMVSAVIAVNVKEREK